ncbi:MAG: hypothetical protein QXP77_01625 [Candidatus Aenigmatarchaeota archaeon]
MSLRKVYLIAGIISLVLYLAGLFTGYLFQQVVFSEVEKNIEDLKKDLENAQLEYMFLTLKAKGSCQILSSLTNDLTSRLYSILNELIKLEGRQDQRLADAKNDYTMLAIRAWILKSNTKEVCEEDVLPILYLYSVPCDECLEQGKILDEIKVIYPNKVLTFTIDSGVNLPIVQTLIKSYNITKTPALVIEEEVYQGLISKEEIKGIICSKLKSIAC